MKKKIDAGQLATSIIGMVIGVFAIVFGFITAYPSYDCISIRVDSGIQFGADYYTDSYQAMAKAANNLATVTNRLELVLNAIGWALVIAGMLIVLVFVIRLMGAVKRNDEEKVEEAPYVE